MSANRNAHGTESQEDKKKEPPEVSKQGKDRNVGSPGGHRKSLSGSFPFFRSGSGGDHSSGGSKPTSPTSPTFSNNDTPPSPRQGHGSAMAFAVQQRSTRKRKGSLRKTALLGTGKLRMDTGKERQEVLSSTEEIAPFKHGQEATPTIETKVLTVPLSPSTPVDVTTPRPFPVPPPVPMVTHPVHGDPSKISSASTEKNVFQRSLPWAASDPNAGIGAGVGIGSAQSTASTTSDDESPTSPHPPLQIGSGLKDPLATVTDSYFPLQPRLLPRPRPTTPKSRSPLAALPPSIPAPPPSEWDYSETRWWGWLILTVTWLVFVVGMGSCFEVWSWAWDVGETPYAPPELEDDPTLPIVGYYPALIILTSVMAWVWCVTAWVGMKYFKHANISADAD